MSSRFVKKPTAELNKSARATFDNVNISARVTADNIYTLQ
jgi:hypothetical protein